MDENIFDFDSQYQDLLYEENELQEVQNKSTFIARENENEITDLELFSIFFDCSKESATSFKESIFLKDLDTILSHKSFNMPAEIELFDFLFESDFENLEVLIQMARSNIHKIYLSTLGSFQQTFHALRESVTKLLLILRCNYQHLNENHLKTIRIALGTFDSMSNFSLAHLSSSNEGNKSSSSNYHLIHGNLEWRWIYLTTIFKIDYFKGQTGSDDAECLAEIKLLIYDLIMLSVSKFQKCNSANLIFTSPFVCSCVKEMWLLLFTFIERLQDNAINFWSILSTIMEDYSNGKSFYEKFPSKKLLMRSSNFMVCRNFDQFSLWLISGIIMLVGSEESKLLNDKQSYELYESLIKNFLKMEQTEENMRVLLLTISDALLNVWQAKSEILMQLWENFQKKINSPFLIAGQSPNFMAVSGSSATSYLEQVRAQQKTPVAKLNPNLSSYSMFVYTLGKMIEKFTSEGQKVQVQRILGRIYTKFPVTKLRQLNEMGIHNILKLFITLSSSTNFSDIASKVSDTLLQIPLEKPNHQQLIMKGHVAMLILYCENGLSISNYLTKLMTQINALIQQPSSSSMNALKVLSESLALIVLRDMDANAEIFENGEDFLIDSWILKYLQDATTAEQDRLYESLTKIIQKVKTMQESSSLASSHLEQITLKLFNILLPHVKQCFGKIESIWIPEMTASLCLLSLQIDNSNDLPKFEALFKTFVETPVCNMEQSIKFITIILKNCQNIQKLDSLAIMQSWIRSSILLSGSNCELKEFTKSVINLPEFSSLCHSSVTKTEEFVNSKEPLVIFISDIGKKYCEATNQEKFVLIEKIYSYFSTFEKWSLPILQQQQQNINRKSTAPNTSNSGDESIMRIYTFIAITFLHCSELIFVRTKTSCFFNVAVSHFILPSSLMIGQPQPRSVVVSIHKVWPLLIEGTSRLNFKNDQHINKVLSDIIVKWAPLLKLSSNSKFVAKPFISVSNFKNLDLVEFFWTKLSKSFLALLPGRKVGANCCLILTVIEEVLRVIEADEKRLMSLWRGITQQVFEMAMMLDENEPAQKTCLNLIERFIKNKNYESSVAMTEHLLKNLKHLTDTTLAYHSQLFFRFLTKLTRVQSKVVGSLLPYLMTQVQKVEQLRGSGRDLKLRNLYEQLQLQCR